MMLNSKSIGNKITEARKKISLSQAELAQQVSISPQAVGKWERGESMPDITTLNRLAEIFGVDLNYFSETFSKVETETSKTTHAVVQGSESIPVAPRKKSGWNWNMSQANWADADFSGLKNIQEKFSSSNMKNCKFINSDLSGLMLKGNDINACDFSASDWRNSTIRSSVLSRSEFINCSLIDAAFSESEISNCNFTKANFSGTDFSSVEFEKNLVEMAVWKFTSFKNSHLANIVFDGILEDCSFENCSFSKVIFQNAKLINVFFKCRSLKQIKFVDCHADRMSYEFLKSGKADVKGLEVMA